MPLSDFLIQTCTVQRSAVLDNPLNEPGETWSDQVTGVACRLIVDTQRAINSETAKEAIVTTYTLLVPANTDVEEGDRITDLVYEDDSEVEEVFLVEAIKKRRDKSEMYHIALELKRVKGRTS